MSSFKTKNFYFRDYTEMDEKMSHEVLDCRNLYEIRKWMVNNSPISYQDHKQFIHNLKNQHLKFYYSILFENEFIGAIDIIITNASIAERGIYIHPNFWGKKLAKKICKEFYKYIRDNWGITTVTTRVFKNNIPSNALELSLGAELTSNDAHFNYYQCNLNLL